MALMTGEQYIESIRKIPMEIYMFGKKVENPVDNPILRPSLNSVRMTYDLAQMPEYQELMTAISPETGERINRFTHIHRSTEDLRNKVKMQRLLGQKTAACFQRCVGMDAFNAEYSTTYEIDKKYGTSYHENFKKFMLYCQENDLTVDGAMTDVKGDRSKAPHAQDDPDMFLHVVIIGGIFFGICSSAEAGAIGCLVFFLMGLIKRTPFRKIWRSIMDTVENMTMLFLILACSGMFAKFMTVSGLAQALTNLVTQAPLSPIVFMVAAVVVFLILGCFLDAYSSIALTIPVFYPAAVALGIDPMQFDLVAILALHMGGLTPPVGLCVYSVKAVAPKDVDVMGIFKGSMPYLAVMIVITLLFIFIPGLSTFIPNAMFT